MGTRILMVLAGFVLGCQKGASVTVDATNGDTDADTDADADGSAGCGASPDGLATTLTVGDKARSFVLALPDDYDPDQLYPIVFAWHGLGGSGALAASYFGLDDAVGSDAVVAYPSALILPDYDGKTGWNLDPNGYDFVFFDALYAHLTDNLCIDEGRVFSTGHSFGGYMSNGMGCYRGDVFNAIAPVAGGPAFWSGSCSGSVAARVIHGSNDDVVAFSDGQSALNRWANSSGCSETTAATESTFCVAFDDCSRDVHWCEHSGEHEWPWFAASAVWDFFSAQ